MQQRQSKSVEAPAAPAAPAANIQQSPFGALSIPTTQAELRAIIATRNELSNQLTNVQSRHNELVNDLKDAPQEARAGFSDQLKVLTDRMVAIETELATTGWQVAHAPRDLLASQTIPQARSGGSSGMGSDDITAIAIVGTVFVLFPIALAFARLIWRRGMRKIETPRDIESGQRLKRMEHSVDAMAIEIERISEGQRFLTQLFARGERPGVLAPAYEPAETTAEREEKGQS
jgi:hypothetical protein